MEIRLRRFSLSDLNKILEIERLSFPHREAWSKKHFKIFYSNYPEGFVVAEKEKEIVGYTIGELKGDGAEIVSLAVAPEWRRKGIGRALTNFLIDFFKKKNIKKFFLHVRTENREAISFYKKIGFKISKRIIKYYQNGEDAYLMIKEMGE